MIEHLVRWFVQQPLHILAVAAAHLILWLLLRASALRNVRGSNAFWLPALAWLVYAAWEWLVLVRTPEADIRVDLLVIWPLLAFASAWALVRAGRGLWAIGREGR